MKLNAKLYQFALILFLITLPLGTSHILSRGTFPSNYLEISIFASDIAFLLMLVSFASTWNQPGKKPNVVSIGCLIAVLSLAFASIPRGTYQYYWVIKILEFALLAYIGSVEVQFHVIRNAFKAIVIMGVLETTLAGLQFLMQHSLGLKWLGEPVLGADVSGVAKIDLLGQKFIRPYGTFFHPNQLAGFLVVACVTSAYLLLAADKTRSRVLYGTTLYISIFGVFLTFSRAGITALCVSLALMALLHVKHRIRILNLSMVTGLAITTAITALFKFLVARASILPTEFNRSLYNAAGWEIFKQHWLTGVGVGNIIPTMANKIKYIEAWQVQPPHIFFLIVACETGVIGLAAIVYFFGSRVKKVLEELQREDGGAVSLKITLLSGFAGILFLMFFDHYFYTLQQTQLLLWFWVGLMGAKITDK